MRKLIVGIVVNVLRHVFIENRKSSGVGCVPTPAWDFAVRDSSEFVVLHPKVGLEDFRCRREAEQGSISWSQPAAVFLRALPGECG